MKRKQIHWIDRNHYIIKRDSSTLYVHQCLLFAYLFVMIL